MNTPRQRNATTLWYMMVIGLLMVACGQRQATTPMAVRKSLDSLISSSHNIDTLRMLQKRMEKEDNVLGRIIVCREIGRKMRNESLFDEALRYHGEELTLAEDLEDTLEMVQALNNLGTDYRRLGVLDVAQDYHYRAWTISKASGDTSHVAKKSRVVALNGLGNIYLTVGNYERADSALRMALAGEKELKSELGQAINYANIGSIFRHQNMNDSAWAYFRKSMELNQKVNNMLGISLCHTYYGSMYERERRYDKAEEEYEKAYELMKASHDDWHALNSLIALASINLTKGDNARAFDFLGKAKRMAEKIKSYEYLAEVYTLYYKHYKRTGDYSAALAAHEKAGAMQDSVVDMEKVNRIQNAGLAIERTQQARMMDAANMTLQSERSARMVSSVIFVIIVLLLSCALVIFFYAQRVNHHNHMNLKRVAQMRENFFTSITHEFRTPLTVILGLSQELQKNPQDEVKSHALTIERQGNRLLTLVTQLLDISKVKSVIGEPNWQHGNICAQVAMLLETYIDYAANRGVTLKYHYDKAIEMDFVPDYVNKVMSNLVSNALKFTPNGGTISVNLYQRGDRLHIDVSDTGHGISSDKLAHIFEPFYTTGDTGEAKGTGIGLALTQEIISHLDGTITAESQVGKGTTFHIVMPIQNRSADPVTETEIGNSGKPIIVVAEDNADVADLLCTQLEPFYEVVAARDGVEALKRAGEIIPDLVITDVMMPNMDGMALARAIRANDLTAHIPIIMVTARVTEQDRIEGIKAGADAYLVKPFNTEELLTRVAKLLEQRIMLRDKYAQTITQAPVTDDAIEDHFLARVEQVIVAHINKGEDITVTMVADDLNITARQLHRKVTGLINQSPAALIRITRINCAKTIMAAKPEMPLKSVALACGFTDYSHFAKVFRTVTGVSPTAWTAKPKAQ